MVYWLLRGWAVFAEEMTDWLDCGSCTHINNLAGFISWGSMVKVSPWQCPARLLCLLRARLAAPDSSTLPHAEARPLGTQPMPRVLELATSKVADLTACDSSGGRPASCCG